MTKEYILVVFDVQKQGWIVAAKGKYFEDKIWKKYASSVYGFNLDKPFPILPSPKNTPLWVYEVVPYVNQEIEHSEPDFSRGSWRQPTALELGRFLTGENPWP